MEERIPGYCALCISRCGCISVVKEGVLVAVEPFPEHPTGKSICSKGKAAPELVYSPHRVLTPLKRTAPKGAADPAWKAIGWDEALDIISEKISNTIQQHGAEAVAFGVTTPSGTGVSDSFALINRLAHALGCPNTVFATENCNWHKDFAPKYTLGDSIGMPDYQNSGCILLWGFNPSTSWLAQVELITQAQKRGAKLIVIDPRKAGLARGADEWLRVDPATDGALAMSIAHQLIKNDWINHDFLREWSNGPLLVRDDTGAFLRAKDLDVAAQDNFLIAWDTEQKTTISYDPDRGAYLQGSKGISLTGRFAIESAQGIIHCRTAFQLYAETCSQFTPESVEKMTQVPAAQIIRTAKMLHESGPVSFYTWTGTAQQSQATQTGRAISLLYALFGDIDSPGGNVYFTKPPTTNQFGFELLSEGQRKKTLGVTDRPLGPGSMGWTTSYDLYQSIQKKTSYSTKVFFAFGGNPLLTKPNAIGASKVMAQLEFYVHADLFLNKSAEFADIVLPVASPWERPGFYPGFQISQQADAFIQYRPAVVAPRGESKSDEWIVYQLAKRLGLHDSFYGGDSDAGFEDLVKPLGLTVKALQSHPEGIALPLKMSYQKYQQQGFATPTKKLEIYSERFLLHGYDPIPQFKVKSSVDSSFPLTLISAKWSTYCHSQHRQLPSLRNRIPEPLVELSPLTAQAYHVEKGDWVIIKTAHGEIRARAKLNKSLSENVVCCQYGWAQAANGNYADLISDAEFDPISSSNKLRDHHCELIKADN